LALEALPLRPFLHYLAARRYALPTGKAMRFICYTVATRTNGGLDYPTLRQQIPAAEVVELYNHLTKDNSE
jgi:hypothetical protein